MIFIIYTSFSSYNGYKLNSHLTCFRRSFITQSVEHRTGIAEVMGSDPVEASDFFLGFVCNCLSYFTTAKISFTSILYPQFTHTIFVSHIHFTALSTCYCFCYGLCYRLGCNFGHLNRYFDRCACHLNTSIALVQGLHSTSSAGLQV